MDEEYQAFLVKNIIVNHHIPLIGVNVAGTGLYLGPFFTWISVIPYWLFKLNPLGTAWASALIGSLTAVVLFYVVKIITNKPLVGYLAGILYAVNPFLAAYDRKYWNPTLIPLLTIIWIFTLLKVPKNRYWLLVIAGIFGIALSVHFSLLVLLFPTCWFLWQEGIFQRNNFLLIKRFGYMQRLY